MYRKYVENWAWVLGCGENVIVVVSRRTLQHTNPTILITCEECTAFHYFSKSCIRPCFLY